MIKIKEYKSYDDEPYDHIKFVERVYSYYINSNDYDPIMDSDLDSGYGLVDSPLWDFFNDDHEDIINDITKLVSSGKCPGLWVHTVEMSGDAYRDNYSPATRDSSADWDDVVRDMECYFDSEQITTTDELIANGFDPEDETTMEMFNAGLK